MSIQAFSRGLIPAPDENDEQYAARCRAASPVAAPCASPLFQTLFGMAPDWVELRYDTRGLHMWEGGCTWIDAQRVEIQLHPSFQKKGSYLGYSQDEVVAHELVHAVRFRFEQPIFEEVLAYQTAKSPFRRYWGPLLRTPNESILFLAVLATCSLAAFFAPLYIYALMASGAIIAATCLRLIRTQTLFQKAHKVISAAHQPLPIMICLTDAEILLIARMKPAAFLSYAARLAPSSPRWRLIHSLLHA